ncbi:MAG TPA: hypothetical protein VKZ69_06745 [Limnochordales bacterium]|nr:hypothetical protein [Limnochordales bacterium]
MTGPVYRLIQLGAGADPRLLDLSPVVAEAVAHSVGTGAAPPTVVLRRQRPYALLGPRDRRLPRLDAGLRLLKAAGLPVYERISGGSAVILDEHCLSFAVAVPCRDRTLILRNFETLTEGVRRGLRRLGLDAVFGEAPGSFCPGPYDLMVDGFKVAGVAQALRGGFALVSGMVLVSQDPVPVTDLLNRFYAAAGGDAALVPHHVAPLTRLLGRPVSVDEVEAALRQGFAELYPLTPSSLTPAERERAANLARARRVA